MNGNKKYKLKYVIIIAAALLICNWGIEYVIERSVRKQFHVMSKTLGCEVYAERVKYKLIKTNLQINNFYIKNPAGYSTEHPMLHVKSIEVQVRPLAMLNQLIHIEKLYVFGATLNVEAKKSPDSIIELVRFGLKPELNFLAIKPINEPDNKHPKATDSWFIRIDDLNVSEVSVLSLNTTGYFAKINFSLPSYTEQNLGQSGNKTPAQVAVEAIKRRADEIKAYIRKRLKSVLHRD